MFLAEQVRVSIKIASRYLLVPKYAECDLLCLTSFLIKFFTEPVQVSNRHASVNFLNRNTEFFLVSILTEVSKQVGQFWWV